MRAQWKGLPSDVLLWGGSGLGVVGFLCSGFSGIQGFKGGAKVAFPCRGLVAERLSLHLPRSMTLEHHHPPWRAKGSFFLRRGLWFKLFRAALG